ncbi:hypothetical protein PRIC1_005015 [Phytophthora ramorum]
MATVLQRVKDKRLTAAQEDESRVVFELAAEGSETMTVKQLKMSLRALGFKVAKGEAQALVYEFDYMDSGTIDLADFQKIFLSKMLDTSEQEKFEQALRALSNNGADQVSIRELSSVVSTLATEDEGNNAADKEAVDGNLLRHQMGLQYHDDNEIEAVQAFLGIASNAADGFFLSKAALAAFLRV